VFIIDKMEVALMQAKKTCPFIHLASASSLRRMTSSGTSTLITKAKQCPVMSQAISSRSFSTSRAVHQAPTKPVKAVEGKTD
jgi:5-aminolevulinate synthase